MTITTGAVEAAARGMFAAEQCDKLQKLDIEANWLGRLNDADRCEYRMLARAALEAAASHTPKPQQITTSEELDALPLGAMIFWAGEVWLHTKAGDSGWRDSKGEQWNLIVTEDAPAKVARGELIGRVADIFLDGASHEASGMDIADAVLTYLEAAAPHLRPTIE